ncbi:MAG: isochorismatase family protein [Chloroflexi bacterium]|nr:isochorismatase family protein [Chloroflexota bacterium]
MRPGRPPRTRVAQGQPTRRPPLRARARPRRRPASRGRGHHRWSSRARRRVPIGACGASSRTEVGTAGVHYDDRAALVVVDLQNDFADPAGSLSVTGGDAIVPTVNEAVAAAIASGALVVATQDWHPPDTPHFAKDGGVWPVHCVAGTWGAELHPAFEAPVGLPLVRKGSNGEDGYSGFSMRDPVTGTEHPTELEAILRGHGVERVVVCGLATDYCVKATALDARRLGFETLVLADAVAAVDLDAGDGERALAEMADAGIGFVSAG